VDCEVMRIKFKVRERVRMGLTEELVMGLSVSAGLQLGMGV
jgi:hypothetical protein